MMRVSFILNFEPATATPASNEHHHHHHREVRQVGAAWRALDSTGCVFGFSRFFFFPCDDVFTVDST